MPCLIKLIIFFIILHIALDVSHNSYRLLTYPTQQGNFSVIPQFSLLNWNILNRIKSFSKRFNFLNPPLVYRVVWPLPLFGYDHLFDRLIFRITHTDLNSNEHEPYKYFNDDGSKQDTLILNERFNLSNWKFMNYFVNKDRGISSISSEIYGLTNHSKSYLSNSIEIKFSSIYIKFLHQPIDFQGNQKNWTSKPFIKFCDIEDNNITIFKCNDLYDLEKIKIDEFKNKIITRID